LER
ncbi:hypothetical protein BVZ66_00975B, partial [Haemophilus influenzae]|jgi:hypothetical protein